MFENVPHAKQAALRRANGILTVLSVQMQSPSSLSQVSIYDRSRCGCEWWW
jgi:hypothetical protein